MILEDKSSYGFIYEDYVWPGLRVSLNREFCVWFLIVWQHGLESHFYVNILSQIFLDHIDSIKSNTSKALGFWFRIILSDLSLDLDFWLGQTSFFVCQWLPWQ